MMVGDAVYILYEKQYCRSMGGRVGVCGKVTKVGGEIFRS